MATFAFYNIGKANQEINRLAARIAELESAKPVDQSAALADALASNDEISKQLSDAKSALETAKTNLSDKSAAFDLLTTNYNSLSTELDAACVAAKCEVAEGATPSEKLASLTGAVSSAIAKTGVNISVLPKASTATAPGATNSILAEYNAISDPVARTVFYRKNKAALLAEAVQKL